MSFCSIIRDFEIALRRLKENKGPGTDDLRAESIKNSGRMKERLFRSVQSINNE